jgi:F-type H+-transporting ATPase subunit alpha
MKLAYSQFEELESFAKFGTRLDDATRKTIDHGERIRACLKQPESDPLSIVQQIFVLLALTNGLMDQIPLDRMSEAQSAMKQAAGEIPKDVGGRFVTADKLGDADKKVVLDIAAKTLAQFQPKPQPKPTK